MRKRHYGFFVGKCAGVAVPCAWSYQKIFCKIRNTDVNTVKKLLAKYYAGESTIDEERVLRRFFEAADVPAELEAGSPGVRRVGAG